MKVISTGIISATILVASAHASNINYSDYATVISSQPNYVTTSPREECTETYEQSTTTQPSSERSLAGPIIGGIAGGLLGNTVGKGSGKTAATAVGAITGAIVGDRIGNSPSTTTAPVKVIRCRTIPGETYISGYTLTVQYNGKTMNVTSSSDVPAGYLVPVSVNVNVTGGSPIPPQPPRAIPNPPGQLKNR